MKYSKLLTAALYINIRHQLIVTKKVVDFFNVVKKIDIDNDESLKKLLIYLNSIDKGSLIVSNKFLKYMPLYKKQYEKIISLINSVNGKYSLNNINEHLITAILKVLPNIDNLKNINESLLTINLDNIKTNNINTKEFIQDFNKGYTDILDFLEFVNKYDLYNKLDINNDFNEFLILQLLYDKCFNNKQFNQIADITNLKELLSIFFKENVKYEDILQNLSVIYNSSEYQLPEFTTLSLQVNISQLEKLGIYKPDENKNIFINILSKYKITDTSIFDKMKIKGKDNLLFSYITSIYEMNLQDIYDSENINIDTLSKFIFREIFNVCKQIDNMVKLSAAYNNDIDGTPVVTILSNICSKKNMYIKANTEHKSVEQTSNDIQKLFEQFITEKPIYKDTAKDKSLLINTVNMLLDDGKLNIEYLENTFRDYIYVTRIIFEHLQDTDLYFIYKNINMIMAEANNASYIMFRGNIIYHALYEDDTTDQTDTSINNEDVKYNSFEDAFEDICKKADETKTPIKDVIKDLANKKGIEVDKPNESNVLTVDSSIPAEIENTTDNVKEITPNSHVSDTVATMTKN